MHSLDYLGSTPMGPQYCFVQYKFFALTDFRFFVLCLLVNLNITQLRIDYVPGNFRSISHQD